MEKKLEVKNLQISFRTQAGNVKAVRDISFDLYKGETLAIVGESGSGKSVTSKAIIGILAGNSIVEGGEILYDGQDLLKISEDDFHKIRGDKIAMIFQDPMSSLNPIMRVGKQITEAMILKGKSSQKNARKDFNSKLKLLNKYMDKARGADNAEIVKENKEKCKIFDAFCIVSTKLEHDYNEANAQAIGLDMTIDNILFLIEKKQDVPYIKRLREVKKTLALTVHKYVVLKEEQEALDSELTNLILTGRKDENLSNKVVELLTKIKATVNAGVNRKKPNFFTLGYYQMVNPEANIDNYSIEELDKMTREYIDEHFILNFIDLACEGIKQAHTDSTEAKKNLIPVLNNAIDFFNQETLDKKESYALLKKLSLDVKHAINYLSVKKKSTEYSFGLALTSAINAYFSGVKKNPIETKKYNRREAKYNKLTEMGKKPTWKLVPPALVDLDLAKSNICKIITALIKSIEEDLQVADSFDSHARTVDLVDYFKELASKVVYKVTRKMAKAKALKLLEEVGIPEPAIRYNQYPFEFSGGMRQRIVIAIALAANPDILICDEPTTALDVTIQSQILELINKIKEERHLSVIFITHDLGVVANMADRIAVMYAGKIVEYGTSEDIFYDPRHPYTWALLSSMPDLETKEKLDAIPGTPPNMIFPPKGDAFAERNKYALEIDFELQPPLFEVSETHYAATWLLHPNAPKTNPPKIILDRIERMKKEVNNHE